MHTCAVALLRSVDGKAIVSWDVERVRAVRSACRSSAHPAASSTDGGDLDAAPLFRPARDGSKKNADHEVEQDRADVLNGREVWFDGQLDHHPERLVFIDEPWTATNMTRSHGRCRRASGCGWGTRTATVRRPLWLPACACGIFF